MYRVIVIVLAFMLGVFIFFGADSAKTRGQKKWVNVIGTLLVWILAVLGAGVLVLCCLAAWDYWKTGDPETAVSLGITAVILAADTMVFLDDKKLGKPADESEALAMLTALQGRHHTVCTGVTVRQGQRMLTRAQSTHVFFRPASETELRAYIAGGEPMDKAGAYGVQGQGALLVERIDGDFFNVMGLPVVLLAEMLGEFGIQLLG